MHTAQVARPAWHPPLSISFCFSATAPTTPLAARASGSAGRIHSSGRACNHARAWVSLAAGRLRLCVAAPPTGGFCFFSFRCEERTRRLRTARSAEVNFRHPHFVTAILRLCCGFSLFELKLKLNPLSLCWSAGQEETNNFVPNCCVDRRLLVGGLEALLSVRVLHQVLA